MLSESKITEIYCMADDFCKFFNETVKKHTLQVSDGKRHRDKPNRLSDAEVITILIAFHMGGHRCLKHFYLGYVCKHWGHLFPKIVSYNRFVELEREVALPLLVFVKQVLLGKCSMGWFFGFKMHLIINEKGEVLSFMITPADIDDREPLKVKDFVNEIYGKLVGDKGYISKELFHELFVDGIQLITKVRNNMKNCLMSVSLTDKTPLRDLFDKTDYQDVKEQIDNSELLLF